MLRKSLVSVALALPIAGSMMTAHALTLQELQDQCRAIENNKQMRAFNIRLNCENTTTEIEKLPGEHGLGVRNYLSAVISMKGLQTQENVTISSGPTQVEHCPVYNVVEIKGPKVPLNIERCDQLTEEYVAKACAAVTKDICDSGTTVSQDSKGGSEQSQSQSQDQAQQQQTGLCTKRVIDTISSCESYAR